MPSATQLKGLGQIVRAARRERQWTLQELSEKSGVGHSYLSNIERGYVNPKRGPVTPSDDMLVALSQSLSIPLPNMHAALGRVPNPENLGSPAAQLVQNKLGAAEIIDLSAEEMDALISRIEDQAEFEVRRLAKERALAEK